MKSTKDSTDGLNTQKVGTTNKRDYEKPQLRTIELAGDEVLAVGCKTTTTGAAGSPTSCVANGCAQLGS